MADFILSRRAKADIKDIGRYTLETWGKAQRNTYLATLYACFQDLADSPSRGSDCGSLRVGYRKKQCGRHLVFYRTGDEGLLEIVRVLHESMDMASRLIDS